jgi:hypothetical protein
MYFIGQGPYPVIITGFGHIIRNASAFIHRGQGSAPVKKAANTDAIFDAYREVCDLYSFSYRSRASLI